MDTLDVFEPEKDNGVVKGYEQNRGDMEVWDPSRTHPNSPIPSTGKRKPSECDRQPESPPEIQRQHAPNNWHREKHFRPNHDYMDTDSPSSYPKHVMVPESGGRYARGEAAKITPPNLSHDPAGMHGGYDQPMYRPNSHYNHYGHEDNGSQYHGHSTPNQTRHYIHDVDTPPHYSTPNQNENFVRPRRWACDYCNLASFVSYEEACAHEEVCARKYHERYGGQPHPSHGPIPQYDRPPHGHHGGSGGLGALYHASQEVGPTQRPPRHQPMWGPRGPSIPQLPHEANHHNYPPSYHHQHHQQGYYPPPRYHGYRGYDGRDGPNHMNNVPYEKPQKRLLLAMPTDSDSLSDRQCYVRSEMVEIFAATSKDVAARHSKGAQKLVAGQVGIRCVHCAHLRPRDRAERAVCYPSSISRIYQTVADMQRFHFEQCREIPPDIRKIYKSLKTTRPRGVGSPQTYWVQSAKLLDLVDTEGGIRFGGEMKQFATSEPVAVTPTKKEHTG